MNLKHKEVRHQFFSSTEDRFKGSIFAVDDKASPFKVGPGAYESKSIFEHDKRTDSTVDPSQLKRVFDVPKNIIMQPGPGSYKNTDAAFQKKDFQKAFISAFNTSDARMNNALKFTPSPGPGAYIQQSPK